ncbi:MAG: hypothetical protein ACK5QW_04935 [Cyanobacteriota bacterium]
MKTPLKFLASLPLAATIALGGFTSEARAQAVVNVPIAANASIDQCAGKATQAKDYQVVICNQTGSPLKFSGSEDDLGTFPIRQDVPAYSVSYVDWSSSGSGVFQVAGNFQIGDSGKFVQFVPAYHPMYKRSMAICQSTLSGSGPAYKCLRELANDKDKEVRIYGSPTFTGIAQMIRNNRGNKMWVFQVK